MKIYQNKLSRKDHKFKIILAVVVLSASIYISFVDYSLGVNQAIENTVKTAIDVPIDTEITLIMETVLILVGW
jgi:hypothetical protein